MSLPVETSEAGQPYVTEKTLAERLEERFSVIISNEDKFIENLTKKVEDWILNTSNWEKYSKRGLACHFAISGVDTSFLDERDLREKFWMSMSRLTKKHGLGLIAPSKDDRGLWFKEAKNMEYIWNKKGDVCKFSFECKPAK